MIAALICGSRDREDFPGRNTFPLLGRPMMEYALLAAQHAAAVDQVHLSSDEPAILRIGERLGSRLIVRPAELAGPDTPMAEVLTQAAAQIRERGETLEALVLLLCNAPTVTPELIDHAVAMLRAQPRAAAVVSVTARREYSPRNALRIRAGGELEAYWSPPQPASEGEVFFPDGLLWVLRPDCWAPVDAHLPPSWIVNPAVHPTLPLVHEGYGDVDYIWQVPAIEDWLRRKQFTSHSLPYRASAPARAAAPADALRPLRGAGVRPRVLITTVPFGEPDRYPLDLLEREDIEYVINPLGRKLKPGELPGLVEGFDALIAGTEVIDAAVFDRAPQLRFIGRVGIGLDGVDLMEARRRNIQVAYTPDAPALAVAELTLGLMLNLLRRVSLADRGLRNGVWAREFGNRLAESTVGVIGVGRVGKAVIRHLSGFGPTILANDLAPDQAFGKLHHVQWLEKEEIYRRAGVITFHLPLTPATRAMVTARELAMMSKSVLLINTARGGILVEADLAAALRSNQIAGAAVDVFEHEPYGGELTALPNCLLTCHMGSMSYDCRARMEREATEETVRFLRQEPLLQPVPEFEYELAAAKSARAGGAAAGGSRS